MFSEWDNQRKKFAKVRNRNRILAQAARCLGSVRGPLDSCTIQNRLPFG